jgi:hypothetical protein
MLEKGELVDFESYSVEDLASTLKFYIREILDGLIPVEICEAIYQHLIGDDKNPISKSEGGKIVEDIYAFLPFAISIEARSLTVALFDLLKAIDANRGVNLMSMSNILTCVTPSIFPAPDTYYHY